MLLAQDLGSPFITNFTSENFPEAGKNWDIAQGNDGKMYFANNYGLVQFDGYSWTRIGQPNNQSELRSFAIHENRIYIGGTSEIGYFEPDASGKFEYKELNPLLKDSNFIFNDVREIAVFKDRVFFLTDNGMMQYHADSISILGKGIPFQVATVGIDEIVFAATDIGLYRFQNEQLLPFSTNQAFYEAQIRFVLPIGPDTYLIGADKQGLMVLNDSILKPWNRKNHSYFLDSYLTHATILNKEQLLFGSVHQGLIKTDYQGNIIDTYDEKDGLLDHNILSLYKDKQGNVWTAVDGSIAYIELNSPFTLLNKKHGLRGEIYCLTRYKDQLYVGTSRGLYAAKWIINNELAFKLVLNTTGQCWQLYHNDDDLLLAHHNGIYQIKENNAVFIGGTGNWNFAPVSEHHNTLLSGSYTGIYLLEKQGERYQVKHLIDGFEETAREIFLDNYTVWVSHGYKGIYKLKLATDLHSFESVNLYNTENGLPSDLYNNLIPLENELLFGTQKGVYQYNAETDLMELQPLFGEVLDTNTLIRKLYPSPNGNYLSIKNYYRDDETALINILDDGTFSIQTAPFQKLKGQLIPASESVYFPDENQIIFGSKQGLIIYDTNFRELSNKNHTCFINELSLPLKNEVRFSGGNPTVQEAEAVLQLDKEELISISYSSSFFEAIPYIEYATYLEGYDEEWLDWDTQNKRELVKLPPGEYTFWVKAKNIYDVESQVTSLSFRVEQSFQDIFQQASPITLLIIAIFIGLSFFLIWHYFSNPGKLVRELKVELTQKQAKINNYKHRKSEWKSEREKINKKLSDVILQNEIYDGLIRKIEKAAKEEDNNQSLEKTLAEFQDDLKTVQLQINAQQTLSTDDFLTKIKATYPDLSARELRLCSYLKLNISSKEIANYLGISIRGVESLRYRIRKKMKLSKEQDLAEFILKL